MGTSATNVTEVEDVETVVVTTKNASNEKPKVEVSVIQAVNEVINPEAKAKEASEN